MIARAIIAATALLALLCCALAITAAPAAPTCTPQPHVMFNTCAHLDTTQVQDRRTHTQGPRTQAPMVACLSEDGSTPGQAFPCQWNGAAQGNGRGDSYVLDGPA